MGKLERFQPGRSTGQLFHPSQNQGLGFGSKDFQNLLGTWVPSLSSSKSRLKIPPGEMLHKVQIWKADEAVDDMRTGRMAFKPVENTVLILETLVIFGRWAFQYNGIGYLENHAEVTPS